LQAFSLPPGKGIFQLHSPPAKGGALNGARQRPAEPSLNAPRPFAGEVAPEPPLDQYGPRDWRWDPLAQSIDSLYVWYVILMRNSNSIMSINCWILFVSCKNKCFITL
jgi:hypothetical protein